MGRRPFLPEVCDPPVKQGIYGIFNVRTGRVYIGASLHMRKRWRQHVWALTTGNHHCREFQEEWTTYGAGAFAFRVLEDAASTPLNEWPPKGMEASWYVRFGALVYGSIDRAGCGHPGGTVSPSTRDSILRQQRERRAVLTQAGLTAKQVSTLIRRAMWSLRSPRNHVLWQRPEL